jgi:hypothetical protein
MSTKKEARWQAGEDCYSRSKSTNSARTIGRWARDAMAWRLALLGAYGERIATQVAACIRTVGRALRGPRGRK